VFGPDDGCGTGLSARLASATTAKPSDDSPLATGIPLSTARTARPSGRRRTPAERAL